jgi:hypothetical protein
MFKHIFLSTSLCSGGKCRGSPGGGP